VNGSRQIYRPRRDFRQRPWYRRPALWVGLLFVLGVLGAYHWGLVEAGFQKLVALRSHPVEDQVPKTTRVTRALYQALKGLEARTKTKTVAGIPVISASLPGNVPPVRGAWAVNSGVVGAGGAVTTGSEEKGKVTLEVSCDSLVLARVVLSQGAQKEAKEARLALVIDDVENSSDEPTLRGFLDFPVPLTLAVLQKLPHSKEIAKRAGLAGKEILLQLPMEPKNYPEENPGPQAIYVDLKEGEIRNRVREALKAVPGAKGVDNHMGSRVTEDPVVMGILLDELKKQGLFFVDAQTTPNSVAYQTANRLGAQCLRSAGFFDDKQDPAATQKTLLALARTAQAKHRVLALGHCRKTTLEALEAVLPKIREMGVDFVPASEVLEE
jgi:polysaccharide deacetylase 2 family uncharacterized protein YibQ